MYAENFKNHLITHSAVSIRISLCFVLPVGPLAFWDILYRKKLLTFDTPAFMAVLSKKYMKNKAQQGVPAQACEIDPKKEITIEAARIL